jgi:hypothetical protein
MFGLGMPELMDILIRVLVTFGQTVCPSRERG